MTEIEARLTDKELIAAARHEGADIPKLSLLRSERKAADAATAKVIKLMEESDARIE